MTTIEQIQEWYGNQCNGDWEHQYGVKIETLDNPGWLVDVDLRETSLADGTFAAIETDRTETDWVHCTVKDQQFLGRGGPNNLEEILSVFIAWASQGR